MNKVILFINEVRAEVHKVAWPKKNEIIGSTIVVCLLVIFFAVLLGGLDSVFSTFIKKLFGY